MTVVIASGAGLWTIALLALVFLAGYGMNHLSQSASHGFPKTSLSRAVLPEALFQYPIWDKLANRVDAAKSGAVQSMRWLGGHAGLAEEGYWHCDDQESSLKCAAKDAFAR